MRARTQKVWFAALLAVAGLTCGTEEDQDATELEDESRASAAALSEVSPGKNEETQFRGVFTDVTVGTQGIGMDVGYSFNKCIKLRVRGTMLQYEREVVWSNVNVKSKLKNSCCGLILDVHPFGGAFRLSAGVNIAPLHVDAAGDLSSVGVRDGIYSLGDYEYKVEGAGRVFGRYKWNTFQPYIGFGWSFISKSEHVWFFSTDLGVNIIGKGKMSVGYDGKVTQRYKGTGAEFSPVDMSALEDSIREEGKDFFKIADKMVVYPVVHFGVGCRF